MATAEASKRAIQNYFEKMGSGDPETAALFTEDVTWWVPPSSPLGGTHEGETQVVTSMPAASDYRVGNSVIAFTAPIEGWGRVERVLYATYGGIYREVDTRKMKTMHPDTVEIFANC